MRILLTALACLILSACGTSDKPKPDAASADKAVVVEASAPSDATPPAEATVLPDQK